MARIHLITGGCRSGKSGQAQKLAESLPGPRAYLATCPVIDDEMRQRIQKHQQARSKNKWHTIEEPLLLADALAGAGEFNVILVDCVTLWINNLMYHTELRGRQVSEAQVERLCRQVLRASLARHGEVIFVTNEVGLGIVPDNAMARRYRDLVGRANQTLAAGAHRVTLVSCGIPLLLKDVAASATCDTRKTKSTPSKSKGKRNP